MKVFRSAQLYLSKNHASQAIPSPEAILLTAIAALAYPSTVKRLSGDIEKTAVSTLDMKMKGDER